MQLYKIMHFICHSFPCFLCYNGVMMWEQMFNNHPDSPRCFAYFSTRRIGCCPALARTSEALLRSALFDQ